MENPADYPGYFNSDSEKLNRVWYAGAYTNQLCTADPTTGNALGIPGTNWYYNGTIASEYFLNSNFPRHCFIDFLILYFKMALRSSWMEPNETDLFGQEMLSFLLHLCLSLPTA
jgi:hypothetical protein